MICLLALAAPALPAEERVDLDMVTKIRQEGFRHSQVMETASELMDRIGPRLTGSPQMKEANDWSRQKLAEWGLANARLNPKTKEKEEKKDETKDEKNGGTAPKPAAPTKAS